jgi:hypothetical protein
MIERADPKSTAPTTNANSSARCGLEGEYTNTRHGRMRNSRNI